jgi:hypothetical protein
MSNSRKGALLLAIVAMAGCRVGQPYYPAGGPGKLNVSGTYDTKVEIYSTTCRGLSVIDGRTYVEHTPGALTFKLTHNDQPFDGRIRPDGSFNTITSTIRRGTGTYTTDINGRFTDSNFYARVTVRAGSCEYQLRWAGTKL